MKKTGSPLNPPRSAESERKSGISPADIALAESAEEEAEAQLAIIRVLKPVSRENRQRIMQAIGLLLEADRLVPGLFEAAGRGLSREANQ